MDPGTGTGQDREPAAGARGLRLLLAPFLVVWLTATRGPTAAGLQAPAAEALRPLDESAEAAFRQHQWLRATPLYRAVLLQAYWQRARLRRQGGRFADAAADLARAQEIDPHNPEVRRERALVAQRRRGTTSQPQAAELETMYTQLLAHAT